VRAQQPTLPVVGYLDSRSPEAVADRLRGFRQGLKESGYVEGENVAVVYGWAVGVNSVSGVAAIRTFRQQRIG
jgi:putative ABC transport system substrate-binding protein